MNTSCNKSWALTVVRVVLGVVFFLHGAQKVLGWFGGSPLPETVQHFMQMGLPMPVAYAVCLGEFLGGIGLIVGCLSRVAAAGIVIIMAGAIATVHAKNGFFINWFMVPDVGHGFEYNLSLIAMGLAIVVGGPGCVAIDNLLFKSSKCL